MKTIATVAIWALVLGACGTQTQTVAEFATSQNMERGTEFDGYVKSAGECTALGISEDDNQYFIVGDIFLGGDTLFGLFGCPDDGIEVSDFTKEALFALEYKEFATQVFDWMQSSEPEDFDLPVGSIDTTIDDRFLAFRVDGTGDSLTYLLVVEK